MSNTRRILLTLVIYEAGRAALGALERAHAARKRIERDIEALFNGVTECAAAIDGPRGLEARLSKVEQLLQGVEYIGPRAKARRPRK